MVVAIVSVGLAGHAAALPAQGLTAAEIADELEAAGSYVEVSAQSDVESAVARANSAGVAFVWLDSDDVPEEVAEAISAQIDQQVDEAGSTEVTSKHRGQGESRLVQKERCDYLRPTVIHCDSPERQLANQEYMFPFVSVVKCPQEKMIGSIGPTLVGTAITGDSEFQRRLRDAINIDRLNLGPVPTIKLNWLQPHEGSIIDFLYRARAYQEA